MEKSYLLTQCCLRLQFLSLLCLFTSACQSAPLARQIIIHPENSNYLALTMGPDAAPSPAYLAGIGSPEGFLYLESAKQEEILQRLESNGGNCLYAILVRCASFGGDDSTNTQAPWNVPTDPNSGLNAARIEAWHSLLEKMAARGIYLFFLFYDDSTVPFGGKGVGAVPAAEAQFFKTMVDEFERHPNLIWCAAEEYREALPDARVSALAKIIANNDAHDHLITAHGETGVLTFHLKDDPNIDFFTVQSNALSAAEMYTQMITAKAQSIKPVLMAENWHADSSKRANTHPGLLQAGNRQALRQYNWACAMAGASVLMMGPWENTSGFTDPSPEILGDLRRLQIFFESSDFYRMSSNTALITGGTDRLLADTDGESYILYDDDNAPSLGIKNLRGGDYALRWLDPESGFLLNATHRQDATGAATLAIPTQIGTEAALWLRRTGDTPAQKNNVPPVALDSTIQGWGFSFPPHAYTDEDGPGPHTLIIVESPKNGTMVNNAYTARTGFIGEDRVRYRISDGIEESNIATTTFLISPPWLRVSQARRLADTQGAAKARLDIGTNGDLHIAYLKYAMNRVDIGTLHYLRIRNGEASIPLLLYRQGSDAVPIDYADVAGDPNGHACVVWTNFLRNRFRTIDILDATATTNPYLESATTGNALRCSVVCDPAGGFHAQFRNKIPEEMNFFYQRSGIGQPWQPRQPIPTDPQHPADTEVLGQRQAELHAGRNGEIYYPYRWMAGGASSRLIGYRVWWPESGWTGVQDTFGISGGAKTYNPHAMVDHENQLHIVWTTNSSTEVQVRFPDGGVKTVPINAGVEFGWPATLAKLATGEVLVVASANENTTGETPDIRPLGSTTYSVNSGDAFSTAATVTPASWSAWPGIVGWGSFAAMVWSEDDGLYIRYFRIAQWPLDNSPIETVAGWVETPVGFLLLDPWEPLWLFSWGMGYLWNQPRFSRDFFHSPDHGWLYLPSQNYPFVYRFSTNSWLWDATDSGYYFDFQSGTFLPWIPAS